MDNLVVFRMFRSEFNSSDYGDIMIQEYENARNNLIKLAKNYDKIGFVIINIPFDEYMGSDSMFEIEYTGVLGDEEKKQYIECAKKLFSNATLVYGKNDVYLDEETPPILVRIRKIDNEECFIVNN